MKKQCYVAQIVIADTLAVELKLSLAAVLALPSL